MLCIKCVFSESQHPIKQKKSISLLTDFRAPIFHISSFFGFRKHRDPVTLSTATFIDIVYQIGSYP